MMIARRGIAVLRVFLLSVLLSATSQSQDAGPHCTVVALGDGGDNNGTLRANAFYISEMVLGHHDAGKPDLLLFVGDNFIPIGLNIAAKDVESEVKGNLGAFKEVFEALGRGQVHAVPGEHDYYSRFAVENTALFGLFRSSEGPIGLNDRGNRREAEIPSWTYHFGLPSESTVALGEGSADSLQIIYFDSAILLRTDPSTWHPSLEALRALLAASAKRPGIIWRVFCAHHPWRSVGAHGGYSLWDDESETVTYLSNCDRDTNATGYVKNWLDPEDLCADRYRGYVDSVSTIIKQSGANVQIVLSAHDRSLQLLAPQPGLGSLYPAIQVITGAAALPEPVLHPLPPSRFTSASPDRFKRGMSLPGFVQLRFGRDKARVVFYSGKTSDPLDMGGGFTTFWITPDVKLSADNSVD
jgi:hypothetical protein